MKKLIGAAALSLTLAMTPGAAFATSKSHHHKHNDKAAEAVVGTGIGAVAGAVVGGPVGAVIGGVAGLFLVTVHNDIHHHNHR